MSDGGADTFLFVRGRAGGIDIIQDFTKADIVDLSGYGPNEVKNALKTQQVSGSGTMITLSDNTRITFSGVHGLTSSTFTTKTVG